MLPQSARCAPVGCTPLGIDFSRSDTAVASDGDQPSGTDGVAFPEGPATRTRAPGLRFSRRTAS